MTSGITGFNNIIDPSLMRRAITAKHEKAGVTPSPQNQGYVVSKANGDFEFRGPGFADADGTKAGVDVISVEDNGEAIPVDMYRFLTGIGDNDFAPPIDLEQVSGYFTESASRAAEEALKQEGLVGNMLRYTLGNHDSREVFGRLVDKLDPVGRARKLANLRDKAEKEFKQVLRLTIPREIYEQRNSALDKMGQAAKLAQYLGLQNDYAHMVLEISEFIAETNERIGYSDL